MIDDLIDGCLSATSGDGFTVALDPGFQGLPETAHGGSVLGVIDRIARVDGPREVLGVCRRRVPLGRPLALLANYSLHYVGGVGSGDLSADYFGAFADGIQQLLGADRQDPPFVGIMSNGTSGEPG